MLDEEAGAAKVKSYHAEKAFYFKTDIVDTEKVDAACQAALKALPQGVKLFGGVHCAAIAPGRQWNHKLKDSIPVGILDPLLMLTHRRRYAGHAKTPPR